MAFVRKGLKEQNDNHLKFYGSYGIKIFVHKVLRQYGSSTKYVQDALRREDVPRSPKETRTTLYK